MAQLELDVAIGLRAFSVDVSLTVARETVALVGPSGAGKTSLLAAIAGLRRPDRGRIASGEHVWFDAARGIDLPPERRSVGLVPQDYALFPHMTVRANVAFGGEERVDELLERLHIAHLAAERPAALSGGERQRVALARALARGPDVLLLDEPLAALDAHTRMVVRDELGEVLAGLGIPAVLVTHDFRDAAALADRVAVMVQGRLRQVDAPARLVAAPADEFVVRFTGGNLLPGENAGSLSAVYPWDLRLRASPPGGDVPAIAGVITAVAPEGDRVRVRVGSLVAEIAAAELAALGLGRGATAWATYDAAAARAVGSG